MCRLLRPFNHPAQWLEADQEQRDGKEAAIDNQEVFPADEQSPKVAQPSEAAFHLMTLPIVILACDDGTAPFGSPPHRAPFGRDAHPDAATAQRQTQVTTIIPSIRHQFVPALFGSPVRMGDGRSGWMKIHCLSVR
jgi:hypothetical protein